MALSTKTFDALHRRIYSLPRWLHGPLVDALFWYTRRTACPYGAHVPTLSGHACWVCGERLRAVAEAWPKWEVRLIDGTTLLTHATSEAHARNLVVYGESSEPGQVDAAALRERRYRVHPDNVQVCVRLK